MAKLILGKTPKTFKPFDVLFVLPDGEEDKIKVTFNYKTRSQFAEFLTELFDGSDEEQPTADGKRDFVALFAKGGENAVVHLSKIIADWDFAEKPTAEVLRAMHDQAPAAAAAITSAYQAACAEGRLGN